MLIFSNTKIWETIQNQQLHVVTFEGTKDMRNWWDEIHSEILRDGRSLNFNKLDLPSFFNAIFKAEV